MNLMQKINSGAILENILRHLFELDIKKDLILAFW